MAYLSPLEKLLGYIDELDDILPEDDKSLLDEMEAHIEAAKRMHGQQETELRHEIETQTARVQELRTQLNQATRDAAASAKAQQELSVTGAYAQRLERDLAATQGDLRALKASSAAAAAAHHKQVIEAGLSAEREAKQRYAAAAARSQEACDAALKREAASAQEAANLKGLVQELEAWGNVVESQKNSAVAAAASLQEQVDYARASQERATVEAQRLKGQVTALLRSAAERPSSNGARSNSNSGGGDNGRRSSRSRGGSRSGGSLLPPHEEGDSPPESDGSNSSNSSALSNSGVVERAALSAKVCDLEAQLTAHRERVQATERFAFEQQARAAELQEALRKAEERASAAVASGSIAGDGAALDSVLAADEPELSEKHRAESQAKISGIAPRDCDSDHEGKDGQDDFKSDDSDGSSRNSQNSSSANTTLHRREILFHSMQSASKPAMSHSQEYQRRSSSSSYQGASPSSTSSTSSSHDRGGSQQELRSPPRGRFRRISPEAGASAALYDGNSSNSATTNDTYEARLPWAQNGTTPAAAHSRVPPLAAPSLPAPTPTLVQGGVSSLEAERAAYEGRIAALQEVVRSSRHAYSAEAASSRGQLAAEVEAAKLRSEVLDLQQRLHDLSAASNKDTVKALSAPWSTPASNSGALGEASSAAALKAAAAAKEALASALAEREVSEKRASRAEAEAAAAQNLATRLGAELTELRATVRRLQRASTLQASPSSLSSSLPWLGQPKVSKGEAEEQALVAAADASSHHRAESKLADDNSQEPPAPLTSEAESSESKSFARGVAEEKASSEAKREEKGANGRRQQQRHGHISSNHSRHSNHGKSRSPVRDHQDRSHRRAGLPNSRMAGMRPPMRPPEQPPPLTELKPVWSAAAQGASETRASAGPAGREKQRSMEAAVAGPEVETNDVVEVANQAEIEFSPETADEWNAQPCNTVRDDSGDYSYGRTIFVAAKAAPLPKRHSPSKAQGLPRASSDINAASTRSVKSPPPPLPPRNRGLSPTSLEKDRTCLMPVGDSIA